MAAQDSLGADDLLREADDLLAQMAKGRIKKAQVTEDFALDNGERPGFQLQCDVNGCSIVPVPTSDAARGPSGSFVGTSGYGDSTASGSSPKDFVLAEGNGWKLGYDKSPADPKSYTAIIASDTWSMAVTKSEYDDFIKLLKNLRRSVATLQICGEWRAENEDAALEMSTQRVWVQGRAPQKRLSALQDLWKVGRGGQQENEKAKAFSLRFIIMSPDRREVEGHWSAETVMQVLRHLDGESDAVDVPSEVRQNVNEAVPA
ncbi:g10187 [Coccomyxa elongata]